LEFRIVYSKVCCPKTPMRAPDPEPPVAEFRSRHSPRALKDEKQPFVMCEACLRVVRPVRSGCGRWPGPDVLRHSAEAVWKLLIAFRVRVMSEQQGAENG